MKSHTFTHSTTTTQLQLFRWNFKKRTLSTTNKLYDFSNVFSSLSLSSILAIFLYSIGHYHYDIYWTFIECQIHIVVGMVMVCGHKMARPSNITNWLQFSNWIMKWMNNYICDLFVWNDWCIYLFANYKYSLQWFSDRSTTIKAARMARSLNSDDFITSFVADMMSLQTIVCFWLM